jgi:hypothetical protein
MSVPMTQEQNQYVIAYMRKYITAFVPVENHLHAMLPQMEEMSQHNDYATREKLMRWIGFMQGALWMRGDFTVDDFRELNTHGST